MSIEYFQQTIRRLYFLLTGWVSKEYGYIIIFSPEIIELRSDVVHAKDELAYYIIMSVRPMPGKLKQFP